MDRCSPPPPGPALGAGRGAWAGCMSNSGDIEILDKQVSLIRDLIGDLDRRREERRRRTGVSLSRPDPRPPQDLPEEGASTPLRLVRQGAATSSPSPGPEVRRPHFRQKRSWNLSRPEPAARYERPGQGQGARRPGRGGAAAAERTETGGESIPWRAFEQLRRERDDLLVQLIRQQTVEQRLFEERAAGEQKDAEIRRLRCDLEGRQKSRFDAVLHRLYRRLAEAEEIHRMLVHRAVALGVPEGGERTMEA